MIDPLVGFAFQVPAMFYTAYFGCENASETYFNKMRIWVEGGVEGFALPDNEKVFFFEPESGLTWAAIDYGMDKTPAGDPMQAGIGARIMWRANYLLAAAYNVQTDANGYPLYDANHRPLWTDPTKPNDVKDLTALGNLRLWVGNLNVLRNMVQWFGEGPLN